MRTKKAVRKTAQVTRQTRVYGNPSPQSTGNALEQTAEVLLVLALFPLTAAERAGFGMLLQRRLERAYTGGSR